MPTQVHDNYRTADVTTAPPQKLHLMLVEAVIRLTERARQHWRAGRDEPACEDLIRAQEILGEMLGGLNDQACPELAGKVAGVYQFAYRALMEANVRRDEAKLAEALRVMEIERETWRLVCERLGPSPASDGASAAAASLEQAAGSPSGPSNVPPTRSMADAFSGGGLSLEA